MGATGVGWSVAGPFVVGLSEGDLLGAIVNSGLVGEVLGFGDGGRVVG